MADIIKILNGEAGFSVRDKLNEVIDKVNASAVVVPVGDAPVFDPAKPGGYPAGSIISYRNEASPDTQFQAFAIYVANSDIPVGVSPEDSAEWLFKGVEYTIEGGNTSKNYVNTITALRSVSDMKNGDTMIVGFESRIYEFVESSESGIKPFQTGVGSWVSRRRVSLSNISRIYTSLDAMEGEEIPLPVGNVVISFADSCVFTITDGNGDAQLPVSLSQPSIVTKVGAGFLASDIEVEPIGGGGGGHTILDPAGDAMPTQQALQFGAGFTVTDEVGKTVVEGGSFSESIPFVSGSLTFDKNKYIQLHPITNTFQFTKSAGNHYAGAIIEACLTADGVTGHKPTFSSDFNIQYDNWDNANGAKNLVRMRYLPEGILTEIRKI